MINPLAIVYAVCVLALRAQVYRVSRLLSRVFLSPEKSVHKNQMRNKMIANYTTISIINIFICIKAYNTYTESMESMEYVYKCVSHLIYNLFFSHWMWKNTKQEKNIRKLLHIFIVILFTTQTHILCYNLILRNYYRVYSVYALNCRFHFSRRPICSSSFTCVCIWLSHLSIQLLFAFFFWCQSFCEKTQCWTE